MGARREKYSWTSYIANKNVPVMVGAMLKWIKRILFGKSIAEDAAECFNKLVDKYNIFDSNVKWKNGVEDADKMLAFCDPAKEFIRLNYPRVYVQGEDKVLELICVAVYKAQNTQQTLH
jgi:hypothetical protein